MHTGIFRTRNGTARLLLCLGAASVLPSLLIAQSKKNPTSKFYVADLDGSAQIDTGDQIDDLNKKSIYNAEGTVVETKPNAASAMVFSNGTGIFFDQDTRVEVKRFDQEPFVPNRTDADVEPSMSQTQAYVPRGTVGLCTSKLVAGSNMTYRTQLGAVNVRGGKVVIQNTGNTTTISNLDGESTVQSGNVNMGGHPLKPGEQAVITQGAAGEPPKIQVQPIPPAQRSNLENKVTAACVAKKTVYFETRSQQNNFYNTPLGGSAPAAAAGPASSSSSSSGSTASSPPASGPVTAFDGDSVNSPPPVVTTATPISSPPPVIVAVPVVPSTLPVQNDASTNTL